MQTGRGTGWIAALLFTGSMAASAQTALETTGPVTQADGRLRVSATAVVERAGVPGVFIVHEGRARFRMVKTGGLLSGSLVILSGLRGDEQIIVHPDKLADGMKVSAR